MDGEAIHTYMLDDIEEKYGDKDPIFIIKGKEISDREVIIDYIDDVLDEEKWAQYKRLGNKRYQLKDYFPRPPAGAVLSEYR